MELIITCEMYHQYTTGNVSEILAKCATVLYVGCLRTGCPELLEPIYDREIMMQGLNGVTYKLTAITLSHTCLTSLGLSKTVAKRDI